MVQEEATQYLCAWDFRRICRLVEAKRKSPSQHACTVWGNLARDERRIAVRCVQLFGRRDLGRDLYLDERPKALRQCFFVPCTVSAYLDCVSQVKKAQRCNACKSIER
jgi:hypothetical protein